MQVRLTRSEATLEQPGNVRTLKVVVAPGVIEAEVDEVLGRAGLGRFDASTGYAWLSIDMLRRLAVVPGGSTSDGFCGMVAFAAEKGWVEGDEVRSHVEYAMAAPPTEFLQASTDRRARWWRTVLGEYPTGIAIVSALDQRGTPQGLVVGSFSSVSLDPPLVCYMPMRTSRSYAAIADATHYCVNVLGAGHEELCRSFAAAPPERRFEVGNWVTDRRGVPRLVDSVVWFECERTRTVEAGDHDIVIGAVRDLGYGDGSAGMPLLFLKGGYGSFTMPRLDFESYHLGTHLRVARDSEALVTSLAEDLGAAVSLCALTHDSVVVLFVASPHASLHQTGPIGSTFPFAAPLGAVFAAWDGGQRSALWRRAGRSLGFDDDAVLEEMTRSVRERGYAVGLGSLMSEEFVEIVSDPTRGADGVKDLWRRVARDYASLGLRSDWVPRVRSVQIPVFGTHEVPDLALAVSISPTEGPLTTRRLDEIVARCQLVASELADLVLGGHTGG